MKRMKRILFCLAALAFLHLSASAQTAYFTHSIVKGETVSSIARVYGVRVEQIYELNPGARSGIRAGDTLRIPQKENTQTGKRYHTIAPGETLYRITQIYQVSADDICNANPGLSATNFQAGKVIIIPDARKKQTETVTMEPEPQRGLAHSNCREMHKVGRRERLADIARAYHVSEQELIDANPELKEPKAKLKKGVFLCIPFAKTVQKEQAHPSNNELFPEKPTAAPMQHIRVGVILPLKERNARGAKMVEFYQGLLLAADSVKTSGTSVDIYAFDSGSSAADMKKILATPALAQTDIIFGPLYTDQLPLLSAFCKERKIKLVVPFTAQSDQFYTNPYLYAVNTPKSEMFQVVNEAAGTRFANYNHVIVNAEDADNDGKAFVEGLQKTLAEQGITMRTLSLQGDEDALLQALNPFRNNLLIPNSASIKTLNLLCPKLKNFLKQHPEYKITLLGQPEWQTYTASQLNNFYTFDTYVFSSFYRNPLDSRTSRFDKKFLYWFKRPLLQSYPRFGMLGFDAGFYFLSGIARYGTSFNEHLNDVQVQPLQHAFRFERVSNWSGFLNKRVRLIHYTPNQTIEIIELQP